MDNNNIDLAYPISRSLIIYYYKTKHRNHEKCTERINSMEFNNLI